MYTEMCKVMTPKMSTIIKGQFLFLYSITFVINLILYGCGDKIIIQKNFSFQIEFHIFSLLTLSVCCRCLLARLIPLFPGILVKS